MKYMLVLTRSDEEWEARDEGERNYPAIGGWFMRLAAEGKLKSGEELRPARTATTVRWQGGDAVVTDGPFIETKETIGGFAVIDVPDLDAAIAVAKSWPAPGHAIEIRPVIAH